MSPNTRKYGPEKYPYLDSFHAVSHLPSGLNTSNGMKSKNTKSNKVSIYLAYLLLAILFIVAHKLLIIWFLYSAPPFNHDACDSCIENKDES